MTGGRHRGIRIGDALFFGLLVSGEIARICIMSTTRSVISVRARPTADGKITYRVTDEYEELWEWDYPVFGISVKSR